MKGIILSAYQHAIDMQKHTNWTLQAMLLAEKRMTFGSQLLAKIRNAMRMNEIQKSLMLGVFAPKVKVVHKYAKERRYVVKKILYVWLATISYHLQNR